MELIEFNSILIAGDFLQYSVLIALGLKLLPVVTPIFAAGILVRMGTFRRNIIAKQNNAEDLGEISEKDISKYQNVNNNNESNSNGTESSTDSIGTNPLQDNSTMLQRYINDLYSALEKGDIMLREAGLGGLVDYNGVPDPEQALQIFSEYMNHFNSLI